MVGWHHRLNGHEFEQTLGDGDGQRSLACCSPWSCKESDTTEQLNNNKHDPSIPLLVYLEKAIIQKDTWTLMFIAVLLTIAKTWMQPKWPSTDEWIKKIWYIYDKYIIFLSL